MVDEAKLDQMLSSLRRYVEVLKSLARVPRAEFDSLVDLDRFIASVARCRS